MTFTDSFIDGLFQLSQLLKDLKPVRFTGTSEAVRRTILFTQIARLVSAGH